MRTSAGTSEAAGLQAGSRSAWQTRERPPDARQETDTVEVGTCPSRLVRSEKVDQMSAARAARAKPARPSAGRVRRPPLTREHHDEERPEVVHQVGLHRRREAQRQEQAQVVGEESIDAEQERRRTGRPKPRRPEPGQAAQPQGHADQRERGHLHEAGGQRGQRCPQHDGRERQERGPAAAGRVGRGAGPVRGGFHGATYPDASARRT